MIRALALLLALSAAAAAHDAPSGWAYPYNCCADHDCRPIACGDIVREGDGSFTYTAKHVRFSEIKDSGDHQCHACWLHDGTAAQRSYGTCLFAPRMS